MKSEQVTRYTARDGAVFYDPRKADEYERELDQIEPIMSRLPANEVPGGKYIQHDPATLRSIKADLFKLVVRKHGESFPEWKKWKADEVHPLSIVGRVLDDCGGPLSHAWSKLARFNFNLGREYEQPYFAMNPDKAVEMNK